MFGDGCSPLLFLEGDLSCRVVFQRLLAGTELGGVCTPPLPLQLEGGPVHFGGNARRLVAGVG